VDWGCQAFLFRFFPADDTLGGFTERSWRRFLLLLSVLLLCFSLLVCFSLPYYSLVTEYTALALFHWCPIFDVILLRPYLMKAFVCIGILVAIPILGNHSGVERKVLRFAYPDHPQSPPVYTVIPLC
jgi:hypothetical protein